MGGWGGDIGEVPHLFFQPYVYLTIPNPASLPLWILVLSANVPANCPQVWLPLQLQPYSSPIFTFTAPTRHYVGKPGLISHMVL